MHGQGRRLVEPAGEPLDEALGHVLGDDDRSGQVRGQAAQDGRERGRPPGRSSDRDDKRPVAPGLVDAAVVAAGGVVLRRGRLEDDRAAGAYGLDGCRRRQRLERAVARGAFAVPGAEPGPRVGDHRDPARHLQVPDEG